MEPYKFLKHSREKTGLSIRAFADAVGIASSSLWYYENGTFDISQLPVGKINRMFSMFDMSVDIFFRLGYPDLLEDTTRRISDWKATHPRDLSYKSLKRKYRLRLAKIKERESINDKCFEDILFFYEQTFDNLRDSLYRQKLSGDQISDEMYETMILPLSHKIRRATDKAFLNKSDSAFETGRRIHEALYASEYNCKDIAWFADVSPRLLSMYQKRPNGYDSMKSCTAYRLAHVFDKTYDEFFI